MESIHAIRVELAETRRMPPLLLGALLRRLVDSDIADDSDSKSCIM